MAGGSVPALTELGLVRDELGDHAGALELFGRAMAAGDLAGYLAAGTAALADGDVDQAERLLLVGIEAGEEQWQWQLAEVFLARDDEAEAERLLRAAIVAGETRAWRDLALLRNGAEDVAAAEFAYRSGVSEGDEQRPAAAGAVPGPAGTSARGAVLARPTCSRPATSRATDRHGRAAPRGGPARRGGRRLPARPSTPACSRLARTTPTCWRTTSTGPSEALEQYELALAEGVIDKATLWWEIGQAHERAGDLDAAAAGVPSRCWPRVTSTRHHALGSLALERGDLARPSGTSGPGSRPATGTRWSRCATCSIALPDRRCRGCASSPPR